MKKEPPRIEDDVYYAGFCLLGGRRLYSQTGPQPLQLTEILAYLDESCMADHDERESFVEVITALDHAEMTFIAKARK